jgi:predicted P-loop ATPase/GTPase
MNLLVAGGDRVDAGKTTFTVGLLERTGAVGFKPRAGNDYWFDHDDYRRAVDEGRLYGKDAKRLADAGAADHTPEAINPIHRLWRPSPREGSGLLGQDGREFLVDRVGDRYVVNATTDLPDRVTDRLPVEEGVSVSSLAEFNDVMGRLHVDRLAAIRSDVRSADRAVVESYADIARPLREYEPDAVAVVEPRRVRIYDGRRYGKGCEVASGGPREGRLEERVPDVVDLIEPKATVSLPALPSERQSDPAAVADAYEPAYDGLLAAAFD